MGEILDDALVAGPRRSTNSRLSGSRNARFTRAVARTGELVGVVERVQIGRPLHGRTGIVVYRIPLSRAPSGASDGPPLRSLARHRRGELVGDRYGYWRL